MSLLSAVSAIVYGAILTLIEVGAAFFSNEQLIYIAFLHFILPIGIAYLINTNSPASRILILIYVSILYSATVLGKGFLGAIEIDLSVKLAVSTALIATIVYWLFASPKMRLYYAQLSDKPIPADLADRTKELAGDAWLGPKAAARLEWIADNLETIVLIGFAIAAIFALFDLGDPYR